MFLTKDIHTPKNTKFCKVNPLRQRTSNTVLPSLLHAWSHPASPLQKIRYPFPRSMWVQKIPNEFSSPCCEIREKNPSPGNRYLSSSPPGLFAARCCQSNGFYERLTAIPGLWLASLLGVDHCFLEKGKNPKPTPVLELNFPSSSSPCSEKGWTTASPKEMVAVTCT